jgi:hypothetical protein
VSRVTSASIRALMYIFHALRTDAPEDSDAALRSGMKAGTFRSRHLKLARPIPHIREVLCLAGVNNFLEIYDTLPAAIDSFQA